MKESTKKIAKVLSRTIPSLLLVIALLFVLDGFEITPDEILKYSPKQPFFAALVLWGLYILKSFLTFFPILILNIAGGLLFPTATAILANLAGTVLSLIWPYFRGKHYGDRFTQKIYKKYPKLEKLQHFRESHLFLFAYIVRGVAILPGDLVSSYLGAVNIPIMQYLGASVLAYLPRMLAATVVGSSIEDPTSPAFYISLAVTIFIPILTGAGTYIFERKTKVRK